MALVRHQYRLIVLLHVLTYYCLLFSVSPASDADILLEWMNGVGPYRFPSWRQETANDLCINWQGVICENGSIAHIDVTVPQFSIMRGELPASFANLTSLRTLTLLNLQQGVGAFPSQIFQLPLLSHLNLEGTFTLSPSMRITSPLRFLSIKVFNYTGEMPLANYSALDNLYVQQVEMSCPLPQAFVDRLRLPRPLDCEFSGTKIWIDSSQRVCGQIHVSEFPCKLYPLIHVPPIYDTAIGPEHPLSPPSLLFNATYKNIILEFRNDTSVSFFVTYNSANGRVAYRDEYAMFKHFPLIQSTQNETLVLSPFESFWWKTPTILYANATLYSANSGGSFLVSWIYEFDGSQSNFALGGTSFKFSVIIQRIDYVWQGSPTFAMSVAYRAPHSPILGAPLQCGVPSAFSCSSEIASWVSDILSVRDQVTITLTTKNLQIVFGYGLVGALDGVPLGAITGNVEAKVSTYFSGIGYENILRAYQESGRGSEIRPAGASQYMNILIKLSVSPFNVLYYDPDVTLRALFDTGDSLSTSPSTIELVDNSGQINVIAPVTVTAIVIAAVIIAFVVYKMRLNKARAEQDRVQRQLQQATVIPTPEKARVHSNSDKWRPASPSVKV